MNKFFHAARATVGLCTLLVCALGAGLAQAALSCTVTSATMGFRDYVPFSTKPTDGSGTVMVNCTNFGITATTGSPIALGIGVSAHGTAADRKMLGPQNDLLRYGLYRDAARSLNWDQGANAAVQRMGRLQANETKEISFTVFGRMPAMQNVHAGSYSDSLIITITP